MSFGPDLWPAVGLTLKLAAVTSAILFLIGLPLAHWLNTSKSRFIVFMETLVTLPIVLPPTVIGFYLLVAFAPQSSVGAFWQHLTGHPLTFTFAGLVVGSVIYSLPFAVQPFQAALKAIPAELIDAARISGANWWQIFLHVTLPIARRGIGAGLTLSFAHTVGEFGVVLMIGGNIAGVTRVASIALYDDVQRLDYPAAHGAALVLLLISFALVLTMSFLQRRADEMQ
ncbi:molybdate ABC transporter permease subunit [soil metagenome]